MKWAKKSPLAIISCISKKGNNIREFWISRVVLLLSQLRSLILPYFLSYIWFDKNSTPSLSCYRMMRVNIMLHRNDSVPDWIFNSKQYWFSLLNSIVQTKYEMSTKISQCSNYRSTLLKISFNSKRRVFTGPSHDPNWLHLKKKKTSCW